MESIQFEAVHKFFRSGGMWPFRNRTAETHALKGISLTISSGEVMGLLGPNGSGKSTTLKLISTTLLPDRGRVAVQGFDSQRAGQAVRKCVGFALAAERSFFPRLTVRENVGFFAALEDVPRREMSGRIRTVLSQVDLEGAADKQAMKLSSGMYQRLGIARALIKRPSVLLLDEPTRSLDITAMRQIWELIEQVSRQGITVVLATHNFEEAASVCDRVALLYQGGLIGQETTFGFQPEQLRDFYMEMTGHRDQEVLSVPA